MSYLRRCATLGLVMLLFVTMVSVVSAQTATPTGQAPSVTVNNQAITGNTVTIARVVSNGPGWIVIHRQEGTTFGADIGHAALVNGVNNNVVVTINTAQATATLYAMLHTDVGVVGTYEFPGADVPVSVGGQVVNVPFTITGGLPQVTGTPGTPVAGATATATRPAATATAVAGVATATRTAAAATATVTLPRTGEPVVFPTTLVVLFIGALLLIGTLVLVMARRPR